MPRVTLTLILHNARRFVGACLQEGQTVLVTEYMENGDLFRALAEDAGGRFGWYRRAGPSGRPAPNTGLARRVALDVARGLFFLHDKKARPERTLHPKSCGSGVLAARLAAEPGRRARRPRRLPRAWVTGELSGRRGRHERAQILPPVRRGSRWQGTPWRQGACGPCCWPCGRCAGRLVGRALEAEPVPAALFDRVQSAQ